DHAFLAPQSARRQLAVGGQARELGARSRAAWRAIVGPSRAEHEVAGVVAWIGRRTDQLDMIDLGPGSSRDAVLPKRVAHARSELGKLGDLARFEAQAVVAAQKEPVAAPRHVAMHGPMTRNMHPQLRRVAVGRYVGDGHASVVMQG